MPPLHFELTDETIVHRGVTLYRIRATRNVLRQGVVVGDVGGYVEALDNLEDNAWVADNAKVYGNARVGGNAQVLNNAQVFDNARVYGNARVGDDAWVTDNAAVFGDTTVRNTAPGCRQRGTPRGSTSGRGFASRRQCPSLG